MKRDTVKIRDIPVGPFRIDIEGKNAEEIAAEMVEVEKVADGLLELGVTFQQLAIAKGLFEQPAAKPASQSAPAAAAPAAVSGPPADNVPRCKHGPKKDLADKGYAKRWYCSGPKEEQKDKGCWAEA